MPLAREQRKLAAIVAADVVGYSRLMGRDESGTLARLRKNRSERFDPVVGKYGGRLVKLTGDGALVEFSSAVDALSAAIEFQQGMAEANKDKSADTALVFRIGLHLGDLIVDGDDLYGDGVNVAARLEGQAPDGGILISRSVRDAVVGRVEATFQDVGGLSLKNIERPVRAFRVQWEALDWPTQATAEPPVAPASGLHAASTALALPDKPSIAVLPFQNMSGDPEQEYFVDGLVEDIITALSRFKSLFVIARNSSFAYKGKSPDIRHVGRELGVRYVLEGSIRKAGDKVRINGQLILADTGANIWADRYDGSTGDIFDLQDKVTTDVVIAVTPRLEHAETERAKRKPTGDQGAYDCYLRAIASIYLGGAKNLMNARQLGYRAIELDPNYAAAHAVAAFAHTRLKGLGVTLGSDAVVESTRLAKQAVALDHDDPVVLSFSAWSLAYVADDLDTAAGLIERALVLNPNLALAWMMSGWINLWLGKPEEGIKHFARSIRLSPLDPNSGGIQEGSAHVLFMAGRYDEALLASRNALKERQGPASYRIAAASAALAGLLKEARRYADLLLGLDPARRVSNLVDVLGPYRRPEDIERYKEGLRLAGLPE